MGEGTAAKPPRQSGRERVEACWGDGEHTAELARIHWMASPVVRAYLNLRASGNPATDWLTWGLNRTRLQRRGSLSILVLGCGEGWLERSIALRPGIATLDACDISSSAVASAAETAREAGIDKIRYHVVDLNEEPPPPSPAAAGYDLIIAHSVLHHVENLERCYRAMSAALAPHGWVLVNEYAGPRRFQFGEAQMRVVNRLLGHLPERLRRSTLPGEIYTEKPVPDEAELIAADPSEAVRSDELARLTRETFAVESEIDYGGTVLQHLLFDLVQNFDPRNGQENRLLALLCFVEDVLIAERLLASDYLVAYAKAGRSGRSRGGSPRRPAARPARALRAGELALIQGSVPGAQAEDADPGSLAVAPPPRLSLRTRPSRARRLGFELPALREMANSRATGQRDCDFLTWALAKEAPVGPAAAMPQRALVLAPDDDWLVRRLRDEGKVGPVDALEPRAAGSAQRLFGEMAAGGGERAPGPRSPRDLCSRAFTNGWLGRAAEHRATVVSRLASALAPGGLLIGDDYLGRPDGRPSASVRACASELLELLQPAAAAPAGRREAMRTRLAGLRDRLVRAWTPFPEGDPVRATAAVLGSDFRVRVARSTGGALLQRLLDTAPAALAPDDPVDAAFLQIVADLEELLEEGGVIPGDYVAFVAERN